jgi:hypothetical protein
MSDVLRFAELDGQRVELLPARTVLSVVIAQGPDGGTATDGADDTGTVGMTMLGHNVLPTSSSGHGMSGGNANG